MFLLAGYRSLLVVRSLAVLPSNCNLKCRGSLHNVLIRDNVTSRIDYKTGAKILECLSNLPGPAAIVPEVLRGEIFKWIANPASYYPFGIDVDHRWQDFRNREHRWLGRGVRLSEKRPSRSEP